MPTSLDRYLLQGGYPAVHARGLDTQRYYADYVASYVERDVRSLSAVPCSRPGPSPKHSSGALCGAMRSPCTSGATTLAMKPTRNAVLYGGDLSAQRTDAQLVGWRDLVLAG